MSYRKPGFGSGGGIGGDRFVVYGGGGSAPKEWLQREYSEPDWEIFKTRWVTVDLCDNTETNLLLLLEDV